MYKVYNKTFQPLQIIFNKDTVILPKRERNSFIVFPYLNKQLKRLEKNEIIRVKKIN